MAKTSHREYLLWMDYLQAEWNQPSRSDYYLMQIAEKVTKAFGGNKKWGPGKFKLPFGRKKSAGTAKPLTDLQKKVRMEQSKARWKSAVGYKD